MKHQTEMLLNNDKYMVMEERTSEYSTRMQLQIRDFQASDVGVYTCISTNSLGKSDGTIRFYEIPPAERITSATQANNANKEPHTTTEQIEIKFIGNHDEEKKKRNKVNWEEDDRVGSGRSRDLDQVRDNSRDTQENFNNNRRTFQSGFSSGAVQSSTFSTVFELIFLISVFTKNII